MSDPVLRNRNNNCKNNCNNELETYCSENDNKVRLRQNSTFVGRVCNDFFNLPWDKIVAGLITGLIIYIGAARLFYLQDKVFETKLEIEKLRLAFSDDMNNLNSKMDAEYSRLNIELVTIEARLYKLIKSEVRELQDNLELDIDRNRENIHNINVKLSILEIKNCKSIPQIQYNNNDEIQNIENQPK